MAFNDNSVNIGKISNSSSNLVIEVETDAKDIIFQQYDGNETLRLTDNGNVKTSETFGAGLQNKVKQMGAFLQSSTHQSLALGY